MLGLMSVAAVWLAACANTQVEGEHLVLVPFTIVGEDVPEHLRELESEVTAWRDEQVYGLHPRISITREGDAVLASANPSGHERVCAIWRRQDGWTRRTLTFAGSPEMPTSRFILGPMEPGKYARTAFDLDRDPPARLEIDPELHGLTFSHAGYWVAVRDDGEHQIVGGIVEDGRLVERLAAPRPDSWMPSRIRSGTQFTTVWLYDGEVAVLSRRALVDLAGERVLDLQLEPRPIVAARHPGRDLLVCTLGTGEGYELWRIGRDGAGTRVDVDWTLWNSDQIWATSPSGAFVGGRTTVSLMNLLPGGVGPDVMRVNRTLAPDGVRAPKLRGKGFVGWLVDPPSAPGEE